MTRFRTRTATVKPETENLAGGAAFAESPELELISMLLTSFTQDQYHRSADEGLKRLGQLVAAVPDKRFVAQAAAYARNEFGMRSITHALIGELVKTVRGEDWVKYAVANTVRRPDDALEMLAYVGKPVPNSLKKGLALAIQKFDEYSLAKYRGENTDCKMVDLWREYGARRFDRPPSLDGGTRHVVVLGDEPELGSRPTALHHRPWVRCRLRLMHDEQPRDPLPCGLFVFVCPATVVRHRSAVE